ncbi:sporulation protein [Peribacillus saganii]|uniref:Sporulation protein n=1 Tax=Peribacillus saganii TaxID=2303992 RepID=A0A372LVD8_9BACI|nr:GerMN domain-containing protein [Peribacillus saganii]RFU71534.1 sporulation protein [Peribacillus saganii]
MSKVTRGTIAGSILASSVLLTGCGLFGGEEVKKIDPPKAVTYVDDAKELDTNGDNGKTGQIANKEAGQGTVKTELYLIDKNGYVVPQTMVLPKSEGIAKQALEYLVSNGPVEEMLPNGFRAVLPAGTEVDVNIKDGEAIADFSKEFSEYKAEDEERILQAITWTLTQFDSVQKVKLRINGHDVNEMPVNGTPVSEGVSRAHGINLDVQNVADITNTKALTVYYIGGEEDNYYYVPVTRRVSETKKDNVAAAIDELVKGPSYASSLENLFMPDVKLVDEPKVADGKVTLNFNESITGSFKEKNKVSNQVLDALVLSLTEQTGIESVEIKVNGRAELVNEEGKPLSEPVMRPEKVNTGSF